MIKKKEKKRERKGNEKEEAVVSVVISCYLSCVDGRKRRVKSTSEKGARENLVLS